MKENTPTIMSELVPAADHRQAWNIVHGADLQAHDEQLSLHDAQRINAAFEIEVYFGTHAIGKSDQDYSGNELSLTRDAEYEAAKQVVDGLEPGDTLLIEGFGYEQPGIGAKQALGMLRSLEVSLGEGREEKLMAAVPSRYIEARDEILGYANAMRQEQSDSAWGYAAFLAASRGVEVVYADIDGFTTDALKAIGWPGSSVAGSPMGEDGLSLHKRVDGLREQTAVNILKDTALSQLDTGRVKTSELNLRKPKLALLFGVGHSVELSQKISDMGLEASVHEMDMSEFKNRLAAVAKEIGRHLLTAYDINDKERSPIAKRSRLNKPGSGGGTRFGKRTQGGFGRFRAANRNKTPDQPPEQ